jgi:crotonobetainyl-CoA:carnitine CoA-transferase CaiB-like acyl-CoA transferase
MRYDAAIRLGVDYESLKQIKPDLIYCHTRGHDRGPRERLPGNDQTGACIAGLEYEDGGMADGGKPMWSLTAFGDTGCGFLSAIGILRALYHRSKTGEGQFVSTAIVNAHMLNCSHVLARPDGTGFARPKLDRDQTGMWALNSLYETADGWIAVVALREADWAALRGVLKATSLDAADFATADARRTNDKALRTALAKAFKARPAAEWLHALDNAGVPAEVSDPTFGVRLHDDAEFRRRNWTVGYRQELVGVFEHFGLLYDFSETPGVIQGPPLVIGDGTKAIMSELGYTPERIAELHAAKAVGAWEPGQPMLTGPKRFIGYKPKAGAAQPTGAQQAAE